MPPLPETDPPSPGQPRRLLDQLRQAAFEHFGRPEPGDRYADWARRFILFHGNRHQDTRPDRPNSHLFPDLLP